MDRVVVIIIVLIVCFQIYFFIRNVARMLQFKNIFSASKSWDTTKENGNVDGIIGEGNKVFNSIVNSMNKYLGSNVGGVIDFNLLKDSIDRHCESVENEISTQTPVPLYCGLAGTMLGVIIGLGELLQNSAISTLMGGGSSDMGMATKGVEGLLGGIAWAMVASICGIFLTTISTICFKHCKLKEEEGKNTFLAWMQSKLLPELPSDISQPLVNLGKNLSEFNSTFSQNTINLRDALTEVNTSYAIQADLIKTVQEMDVAKMARANVNVLKELQQCTEKLEEFYIYLDAINGYTKAIHHFESLFNKEAERVHILEEIRDFFKEYKGSITKITTDADDALHEALKQIKESTSANVGELTKLLTSQGDTFKEIAEKEKETFVNMASHIAADFESHLALFPNVVSRMDEISQIPSKLDQLIKKIESSNASIAQKISKQLDNPRQLRPQGDGREAGPKHNSKKYKIFAVIGVVSAGVIALYCIIQIILILYFFVNRFL